MSAVIVLLASAFSYWIGTRLARGLALLRIRDLELQLKSRIDGNERLAEDLNAIRRRIEDLTSQLQTEIERRSSAEERAGRIPDFVQKIIDFESKAAATNALITSLTAENAELQAKLTAAEHHHESATAESTATKDEAERLRTANACLSNELAESRAKLEAAEAAGPKVDAIKAELTLQFESLASQILTENSREFSEQNRTSLSGLLDPLRERIREFQQKVEETHSTDIRERASLKSELARLEQLNRQMTDDAVNLTNALKGNSKSQGTWGELVLDTVLESAGLREGHEFARQLSLVGDDGTRQQPDIIINLPGDRYVVIDSKVSLTAYEQYVRATSDADHDNALKAHIQSVRSHIKKLGEKNYQDLHEHKSLDFVLMFIPVESAAALAIQGDPGLQTEAWQRNLVLASPANLIGTLRVIANLWLREQQSQNAREIAQHCASLFDKFVGFVQDLEDVGTKLGTTQKSYDAAMSKLSTGRGNLVRQVERIRKLGVKPSKHLPARLLDRAGVDEAIEEESDSLDEEELSTRPGPERLVQSMAANALAGEPHRC
jgi:DNA recombination protein RmuC